MTTVSPTPTLWCFSRYIDCTPTPSLGAELRTATGVRADPRLHPLLQRPL